MSKKGTKKTEAGEELVEIAVTLEAFDPKDKDKAFSLLAEYEADENILISVLVSAGDIRALKKAYPNYFGSTDNFIKFLSNYDGAEENIEANE